MKKKLSGVIKQSVKQSLLQYFQQTLLWFGLAVAALVVVWNAGSSQLDKRFGKIFNNDRSAYVSFLAAIQNTPEFPQYLARGEEWYGPSIRRDVFAPQETRQQQIEKLEAVLKKNPDARDVLVALSQLYKAQGDAGKAQLYIKHAKEIDPTIR